MAVEDVGDEPAHQLIRAPSLAIQAWPLLFRSQE